MFTPEMRQNIAEGKMSCAKCGKPALAMVHTVFLCGECIIKWNKKQQEKMIAKQQEVLEDIE